MTDTYKPGKRAAPSAGMRSKSRSVDLIKEHQTSVPEGDTSKTTSDASNEVVSTKVSRFLSVSRASNLSISLTEGQRAFNLIALSLCSGERPEKLSIYPAPLTRIYRRKFRLFRALDLPLGNST